MTFFAFFLSFSLCCSNNRIGSIRGDFIFGGTFLIIFAAICSGFLIAYTISVFITFLFVSPIILLQLLLNHRVGKVAHNKSNNN